MYGTYRSAPSPSNYGSSVAGTQVPEGWTSLVRRLYPSQAAIYVQLLNDARSRSSNVMTLIR